MCVFSKKKVLKLFVNCFSKKKKWKNSNSVCFIWCYLVLLNIVFKVPVAVRLITMKFIYFTLIILLIQVLILEVNSIAVKTVYYGPRKYKTIWICKWLPPIKFSKKRKLYFKIQGYKILKRPKLKLNLNVPLSLPVELNKVNIGSYSSQFMSHPY